MLEPLVGLLHQILLRLYETAAFGNMGIAVIELTILLRLVLLPLTILAERSSARYERLSDEVAAIQLRHSHDPVLAGEEVRALLKQRRINPWAKALVLLLQLLVLIALYRVFTRDAAGTNGTFLGFSLISRNVGWAGVVGVVLYLEIVHDQRKAGNLLTRQDAVYRYAFPLFSVVVLSILPMVKALFVLTSMGFSLLVSTIRRMLWPTASTN